MQDLLNQDLNSRSYDKQEWQRGYESQPNEYEYWIEDIEGEIPPQLLGTLFRNGPGLLDINGTPVRHPFDGDGMISAISFQNGRAYFRNCMVRTEAFIKEQKVGKPLYRGVFGTAKPGGWLNNAFDFNLKNIANTNVIYWGNKLLALWEAAEPYRLDPHNLETLGVDYLDGILQPRDAFSAHPWIDPYSELDDNEPVLVNFGLNTGLSSTITIYEFNQQGKLLRRHPHSISGFAFIHDFAITPNYCIFFQNPVAFNPIPFVLGLRGAGECLKFQPDKPTQIVVIPRKPPYDKERVQIIPVQSGFVFHHANALEIDGKIIIDSIAYESLPQLQPDSSYKEVDFDSLSPGKLWRFKLDLSSKTVEKELMLSRCCEFPSLHPNNVGRDYRYLFIAAAHHPTGNAPLQAILKLDLQTKESQLCSFAPHGYVSEPIFVPKPDGETEDDGWVLVLVYQGDRHRSSLVILDGKDFDQGAIAQLNLKHHIPYGLHGSWTSDIVSV